VCIIQERLIIVHIERDHLVALNYHLLECSNVVFLININASCFSTPLLQRTIKEQCMMIKMLVCEMKFDQIDVIASETTICTIEFAEPMTFLNVHQNCIVIDIFLALNALRRDI
jgi:hypothetical protein